MVLSTDGVSTVLIYATVILSAVSCSLTSDQRSEAYDIEMMGMGNGAAEETPFQDFVISFLLLPM